MKGFYNFLYIILVLFSCIGGMGYCFYAGQPQFGVAILILFAVLALAWFKVIELPTKDNFNE